MNNARLQQYEAIAVAAGVGASILLANRQLNAPGGPLVQKTISTLFTGVGAKPTPTGPAKLHFGFLTGFSAALPLPVGYVPAEVYDLPPDVYVRLFGAPRSKTLGLQPSDDRLAVYEAREYATRLNAQLRYDLGYTAVVPFRSPRNPEDRPTLTASDVAFLQSLPPGFHPVQELLPELQTRFPGAFGAPVAMPAGIANPDLASSRIVGSASAGDYGGNLPDVPVASIQPEKIATVNAAALVNEAAAEGIRRELVHERADP